MLLLLLHCFHTLTAWALAVFLHRPISFSGQVMNMPLTQTQWHPTHTQILSTFAHPHTHEGFTVNGGALEKHFSSTWISCQTFPLFFLSIFCVNIFETFWQSLLYLLSFHTLPAALNWAMFCFALLRTFFLPLSLFLAHFVMMLFLSFLRRRGSCRTFSGNTWLKWWQLIGLGFHLLSLLTAQLLRHTGVLWVRASVCCVCVCVFPSLSNSLNYFAALLFLSGQILNS